MKTTIEKHVVAPENAAKFKLWLDTRGGIAIWDSADLSNPGQSWSTPVIDKDGAKHGKPHWAAAHEPSRIITDIDEIEVHPAKEVKRFKIATRMGGNGLVIKLSAASSDKLRAAVKKAGADAWYEFDYGSRDA